MMDVHPLQTPNTVLTDCLNGTFITYNGNEHVLQNDMGNFKLEKCKLKENYVPIGTASYGDILYIASYNPIDKKFELGSYPSPLQWNSSEDNCPKNINSIIETAIETAKLNDVVNGESDFIFDYSSLSKDARKIVFDLKKLHLSPGDKYKLEVTDHSKSIMEKFTYFVLDENNVSHEVFPKVNNTEWSTVDWQIPGYLGYQNSVMSPYEHNMYFTSFPTITRDTITYSITSVLNIMDDKLCDPDVLKSFVEGLQFEIMASVDDTWTENTFIIKNIKKDLEESEESNKNQGSQISVSDFSSLTSDWLYDKKKVSVKYQVTIPVSNFGKKLVVENKTEEGDEKEIITYELPITLSCVPMYYGSIKNGDDTTDYYTIRFDNLKSSLSSTANGKNIPAIAQNTFRWKVTEQTVGINVDITVDQYYSDSWPKWSACVYEFDGTIDESNKKLEWHDIDSVASGESVTISFNLDTPYDKMYVIFFSPDKEISGSTARFFYIGSKDENLAQGTTTDRWDKHVSLNNKALEILKKNLSESLEYTFVESDLTETKGELVNKALTAFSKQPIDHYSLLRNSEASSEITYTGSHSFTHAPTSVEKNSFFESNVKYEYKTTAKDSEYSPSQKFSGTFTHKVDFTWSTPGIYVNSSFSDPKKYPYNQTEQVFCWFEGAGDDYYFSKDVNTKSKWGSKNFDASKSYGVDYLCNKDYIGDFMFEPKAYIVQLSAHKEGSGGASVIFKGTSNNSAVYFEDATKGTSGDTRKWFLGFKQKQSPFRFFVETSQQDAYYIEEQLSNFYYYPDLLDGLSELTWTEECYIKEADIKDPANVWKHNIMEKVTFDPDSAKGAFKWLLDRGDLENLFSKWDNVDYDESASITKLDVDALFYEKEISVELKYNTHSKIKDYEITFESNAGSNVRQLYEVVGTRKNRLYYNGGDQILCDFVKKTTIDKFKQIGVTETPTGLSFIKMSFGRYYNKNYKNIVNYIPTYITNNERGKS